MKTALIIGTVLLHLVIKEDQFTDQEKFLPEYAPAHFVEHSAQTIGPLYKAHQWAGLVP